MCPLFFCARQTIIYVSKCLNYLRQYGIITISAKKTRRVIMIRHIVMWRLAPSPDMAKRAMDIKENLEALKDKIDLIVDIEVGININTSDMVSDVVLISTFNSVADLNEYQTHPAHKAVRANYVMPYVEEKRTCDYEF